MEYGLAKGLAVNLGYDQQVADMRYNQELDRRAATEAEARAKMFVDAYGQEPIGSVYDDPIIRDYTKKRMMDAVNVTKNNPNWKYDPTALAELKAIKNDIKGNQHVVRAIAYKDGVKRLREDLAEVAKNPEQYDKGAYDEILMQIQNYDKYGNQYGPEAAEKQGPQAFVYTKPRNFINLDKGGLDVGNSLKDYNVIKGKNLGEYWTEPKPEQVQALTNSFYQENKRQLDLEAAKRGYLSGYELGKSLISAGFNKHYSIGDANALWERNYKMMQYKLAKDKFDADNVKPPVYSTWDDFTNPNNKASYVNQGAARKIWGDKPAINVVGNNGKKADLTGFEFNYDGRMVDSNGIKFLTGTVNLPLNVAEEKGIYKQGWFTEDGVTSDFLDKAQVETGTDKDGKEQKYVKVQYALPIDPNDQSARSFYDTYMQPDKLVQPPINRFGSGTPAASRQEWLQSGWTDEQIKQAAQMGKIIVR